MKKQEKQVYIKNARSTDQIKALEAIEKGKFCPFCSAEYLKHEHKKPILHDGEFWIATENRWPLEHSKVHLLFIHKKHIDHVSEMSNEAWIELRHIVVKMTHDLNMPGATLIFRFGDSSRTGGTVTHLHAQLISGDPEKGKPVLARVG